MGKAMGSILAGLGFNTSGASTGSEPKRIVYS